MAMLLRLQGHEVKVAHNGPSALELAVSYRPQMMFLDIGMPGMDGFELLRAVQAARPQLPVILITGQVDLLDQISPVELGRYRLFTKPFDGEELLTAISAIGSGRRT